MISYSKNAEIPFNVYNIKLTNIPVAQREKLRVYEKYIVLALKNGIEAFDIDNLKDICSEVFNIKRVFVELTIDFLFELGYINFDKSKNLFRLSEKYEILYDNRDQSIMLAKIDQKKADFSKVVYIEESNKFLNVKHLPEYGLTRSKKEAYDLNEADQESFRINKINKSLNEVQEIVSNAYKDDNSSFSVLEGRFSEFGIKGIIKEVYHLGVSINYEYDGKQSLMSSVNIPSSFSFDSTHIDSYCEKYKIDNNPPRFLKYANEYEEQLKSLEEAKILAQQNEELEVQNEIISEELIKLSKQKFKAKDSEALKEKKEEIKQKQEEKKKQIEDNNKKISLVEQSILNKFDTIKEEMDPEIKKVYEKYNKNTQFDIYMREYCSGLDQFVSMCMSNASNSEIAMKAGKIRNYTYQLLKPILDEEMEVPRTEYAETKDYFSDESSANKGISKIYNYCQKKNMHTLWSQMKYYQNNISNPLSHWFDTKYKDSNEKKIKEFFSLNDKEKRDYLLSYVRFYGSLNFTKKQKRTIMALYN